ncbi:hypothetical protein CFC21_047993 [Triticum aestivum]|uniref:Uncharacterized protein n=2 Tax=Triticum aestivum TaxID=4565 RepID=A0A3B6GVD8_WHEAT|nr:uncharacterized protein LOC123074731 [Triticum aestivum]KAF7037664.1 hypothetical protein CFC21_047993 [Triticum aestivum]
MARSAALLLLLLALLLACSGAATAAAAAGRIKSKAAARSARAEAEAGCRDLATRGKCVASGGGGRCRWCRSDALDDMCFGAAEAWRLPKQVFSCDQPAGAAHARR